MEISEKHFCLILAGGKGRRLWPCSREQKPKQFIDFFGTGRTQLQQAYDRMVRIVPRENIYVSTQMEYSHWVTEQLPELPPTTCWPSRWHVIRRRVWRGLPIAFPMYVLTLRLSYCRQTRPCLVTMLLSVMSRSASILWSRTTV